MRKLSKRLSLLLIILLLTILFVSVVVISGLICGDSHSDTGDYANVGEMKTKLEKAGISGIDWWEEGSVFPARTFGILKLTAVTQLQLATFANTDDQSYYLEMGELYGHISIKGDLWVVLADTTADAQAVQEALGGQIS